MPNIKVLLKRFLGIVPWQEDKPLQQKQITEYLNKYDVRKIQFGCGPNHLDGWLNTDICKGFESVVYLDITQELPLPNNSVDYMTSEHLIEHINFIEGRVFLERCLRVLKTKGTIRITTPNLKTLLEIYGNNTPEGKKYINYIIDQFVPGAPYNHDVFVINNAFRNWGHQFLYDASTLHNLLIEVGFVNITQLKPGFSDHPSLVDIDVRHKLEFSRINDYEVMVFEATKP
jgi:predicted SAM-dependent methyltransferase